MLVYIAWALLPLLGMALIAVMVYSRLEMRRVLRTACYSTRFNLLRTKKTPPIVIVVDGIIGAGKSTLLEVLKNQKHGLGAQSGLDVCFIEEPADVWVKTGILQQFYSNPKEYAYRFQTFVFVTRVEAMQRAVEANPNADLYVMERSIFTDRFMFVQLLLEDSVMTSIEKEMYLQWWQCWRHAVPFHPQGFIYLDTDSEECTLRILSRARDGETIPIEYNEKLRLKHEAFYQQLGDSIPVIRIPHQEAGNYRDDKSAAKRVVQRIHRFVEDIAVERNVPSISAALLALGP